MSPQEFVAALDAEALLPEILELLKSLVAFDTVRRPAEPGMPFGRSSAEALAWFVDLAKRDGFTANPGVTSGAAEKLLSDEAAEDLTPVVYGKIGDRVAELPIDALNENFKPYSYINAKILRQKGLIPESATEVKITSYGKVDKPLMVQASAFGPGVAKIIILAGGRPIQMQ